MLVLLPLLVVISAAKDQLKGLREAFLNEISPCPMEASGDFWVFIRMKQLIKTRIFGIWDVKQCHFAQTSPSNSCRKGRFSAFGMSNSGVLAGQASQTVGSTFFNGQSI
jgi:hypothetical protein